MAAGRQGKDGKDAVARPPGAGGKDLLTATDLFGELLDPGAAAPPPAPPRPARKHSPLDDLEAMVRSKQPPPRRKGPVKVRVKDPRQAAEEAAARAAAATPTPAAKAPSPPAAAAATPVAAAPAPRSVAPEVPRDVHLEFASDRALAAAPAPRSPRRPRPEEALPADDLSQVLLTERIRQLHSARRSGVLTVSNEECTKRVFFKLGRVVFASSTLEKDRFGEHLIRLGRISRAEFATAYAASLKARRRLGQTLVQAGLLDSEDLGRMAALQVQKIVLSLFGWTRGSVRFEEHDDPIPADLVLDMSTHRLLFEGARLFPEAERLERALGDTSRKLRVATVVPFDYTRLPFLPAERKVLEDAADECTVDEMLGRALPRPVLVRAVYALWAGGIIEEQAVEKPAEPLILEEDTGTFRIALADAAPPPPEETDVREEVLHAYEALTKATHYQVLGVAAEASRADIEETYKRLTTQEEKGWKELKTDLRLSSLISTIRLRRREAYLTLSNPERRSRYDQTLSAPAKTGTTSPAAHGRAARLVREARRLADTGHRDRAISFLVEAVGLDDRDVAAHRMLAQLMAEHPTLAPRAERHFVAALEANPEDTELRYLLATYYRQRGLADRAIGQLKSLLAVHPDHDRARRDLNALELMR